MKKVLALLLAMMMVAALFAGCGSKGNKESAEKDTRSDAEKIVGTWKGEVDMSDVMQAQAGDEMEIKDFKVEVTYEFKEDGTYATQVSEESVGKAMESLIDSLLPYLKENMKTEAEALGMSVDQLLEAYGMTEDDLGELMLSMVDTSSMMDNLKREGKYQVKDGKIYINADTQEELDESTYGEYTLKGDTLTLTVNQDGETYSMVFKRAG